MKKINGVDIAGLKRAIIERGREIVFDEEAHKYFVDGKELTSVSNTLEFFNKGLDGLKKTEFGKEVLAEASSKGHLIHSIIEEFIYEYILNNSPDHYSPLDFEQVHSFAEANFVERGYVKEKHLSYLINFADYLAGEIATGWWPLVIEARMYSKEYLMAGTCDLILYKTKTSTIGEGSLTLKVVDWKTGIITAGGFAQVGLYKYLLLETIKKVKIDIAVHISTELAYLKRGERA